MLLMAANSHAVKMKHRCSLFSSCITCWIHVIVHIVQFTMSTYFVVLLKNTVGVKKVSPILSELQAHVKKKCLMVFKQQLIKR